LLAALVFAVELAVKSILFTKIHAGVSLYNQREQTYKEKEITSSRRLLLQR
jgi:hypothetical protein